MKKIILSLILAGVVLLSGCADTQIYNPDDFLNPNKVVEKKIKIPGLPSPKIKATYGIGNDPLVERAYKHYVRTGKLETIKTPGWITYPYSVNTKPIMECQPLRLCVVQLESGEKLNSVNLGNSIDWKVGEFITGEGSDSTVSITIKPTQYEIATDLIISTSKRTYNIGLVSKQEAKVSVLRFYYPQETRIASILAAQRQQGRALSKGVSQTVSTQVLHGSTHVRLGRMNFHYRIKGDSPPWRPLRVFDDGRKTYIQMPVLASKFDLPILYLARKRKLKMVNYRYKKPYFVIDGLFSRAWLISGKGSEQVRVEILNQKIRF